MFFLAWNFLVPVAGRTPSIIVLPSAITDIHESWLAWTSSRIGFGFGSAAISGVLRAALDGVWISVLPVAGLAATLFAGCSAAAEFELAGPGVAFTSTAALGDAGERFSSTCETGATLCADSAALLWRRDTKITAMTTMRATTMPSENL